MRSQAGRRIECEGSTERWRRIPEQARRSDVVVIDIEFDIQMIDLRSVNKHC
jgi:hypothetical protein